MTSLIPNPRQAGILATVRELGSASVEALADRFDVTLQTVRRDVKLLADAGLLARFHGGVRLPASTTENIAYRQRQRLNEDAKRAIAQAVAAQVPEGCSLILNIGTTAEAIALALLQHRGLRVITNNLNVAAILSDAPGCEVTVAGGQVRSRDRGIIGETTVEFQVPGCSPTNPRHRTSRPCSTRPAWPAPADLPALDQGTSSSRSIVFDADGRIVAMAQREFRQIYPSPAGWSTTPRRSGRPSWPPRARRWPRPASRRRQVAAIGITNQRETTVVWNRRTGRPIHNAIVWQDRRGEPLCAQLREPGPRRAIRRSTGLVVDAYFSATKLRWMLDHVPGAHIAAARGELAFGTVDSWLLWKLTGGRVHATDVSNASRTMLFDIRHNVWDHELLAPAARARQRAAAGAPVQPCLRRDRRGAAGRADPDRRHGRRPAGALFGQACFRAGLAKNTYGTGCFMLMHTGAQFQTSDTTA
jgi:DNA-binding Lrp family transcriptional regulator